MFTAAASEMLATLGLQGSVALEVDNVAASGIPTSMRTTCGLKEQRGTAREVCICPLP